MPKGSQHDAPGDAALLARAVLLDHLAGTAVRHLRSAGISSILLKGAAIARWLYRDGGARPYVDVDLLVSPRDFDAAKAALAELGYVHWLEGAAACEIGPNEEELLNPAGVCIDLHHGLIGVPDSERCWEVLSNRTVPFTISPGMEVPVLDVPARAMHLALHAVQNGPADEKAFNDLARGLEQVPRSDWRQAAVLASELGAVPAFAAGLRLLPAGAALADEMSLSRSMSVELAIRTNSANQRAFVFQQVAEANGIPAKVALLGRKAFPTAAYLRGNYPVARRGTTGLLRARLWHLLTLPANAAHGYSAWRRAREKVERDSGRHG